MNNIFKWFFGFTLLFILIIVAIWLSPAVPGATGTLHPEFKTMLKSGNYTGGSSAIQWLSYLFGLGIIGIFAFCVFIGSRKKDKKIQSKIYRVLFIGFSAYILTFSLMVFSYWNYQETNSTNYFGGFPLPTAWMLYGMWFVPAIITSVYIFKFDDWVLTREEEKQFHEIVAARRKREIND